jgi:hypothetical protein
MRKTIEDSLSDASSGRSEYLKSRIDRVLGEFQGEIGAVTLSLAKDAADDTYVVELSVTPRRRGDPGSLPFVLSIRRQRLPDALAAVFDAAERRMRFGPQAVRPRFQRMAM